MRFFLDLITLDVLREEASLLCSPPPLTWMSDILTWFVYLCVDYTNGKWQCYKESFSKSEVSWVLSDGMEYFLNHA